MALESFNAYHSYLDAMEMLNDAERGRLFTALLIYSSTGADPDLRGNERFIFPTMKEQIDRDAKRYTEKCRKQSDNAKKRWDATACQRMPNDADDAKEKEKEKEKAKTKEKAKESIICADAPPPRHKYGKYANVLLSDEDLDKLKAEFPDWETRIERLSEYIASKGAKYKNHLATIRAWARKDKERNPKIDQDYGDPMDFYK